MKKLKKNVSEYSGEIPADLLIDISLRCPSKSVASFRCVSKFWSSVLGRPEFTESFLTKSLTCPRLLFAFQVDGKLFFSSSLQAPNPKNKTSSLVLVDHQISFPTDCSSKEFHHMNGLVCRQEQRKTQSVAVICHPSTGQSVTLPQVKTKRTVKTNYFIGYDPMEKQFKVLSINCYLVNISNLPQDHRVMTLGNGEYKWRKIKNCKPDHYPLDKEICINGVLYYLANIGENSVAWSMIVCFDVSSEIFSFINIDAHMSMLSFCPALINYKGKLGAVKLMLSTLKVFILEDAKKHEWSNRTYQLRPLWKSVAPKSELYTVGMTGTGEIVFSPYFLSEPFYVYFFNPDSKILTITEIHGFEKFQNLRVHTFQDYVEDVNQSKLM